MQYQGGGVTNLTQIGTRNHYDLQNLNYSDDHLLYSTPTFTHYSGTINFGLDANKPSTSSNDDVYIATDTKKRYISFGSNNWQEVYAVNALNSVNNGGILFNASGVYNSIRGTVDKQVAKWNQSSVNPYFSNTYSIIDYATPLSSISVPSSGNSNLFSYTLPAGLLGTSDGIRVKVRGTTSGTPPSGAGQMSVSFGGNSYTSAFYSALAVNKGYFEMEFIAVNQASASSQNIMITELGMGLNGDTDEAIDRNLYSTTATVNTANSVSVEAIVYSQGTAYTFTLIDYRIELLTSS